MGTFKWHDRYFKSKIILATYFIPLDIQDILYLSKIESQWGNYLFYILFRNFWFNIYKHTWTLTHIYLHICIPINHFVDLFLKIWIYSHWQKLWLTYVDKIIYYFEFLAVSETMPSLTKHFSEISALRTVKEAWWWFHSVEGCEIGKEKTPALRGSRGRSHNSGQFLPCLSVASFSACVLRLQWKGFPKHCGNMKQVPFFMYAPRWIL